MNRSARPNDASVTEVSIVMPCLNEADTLAVCIDKARMALDEIQIDGEIIVADNGSTDGSDEIAVRHGARVVRVAEKGYGSALMGGIAASHGKFVIMGDADDSYDFLEIPKFVEKLRDGADLVQGCRLPSGGGRVLPGAMPWLHRWIGNPMFSRMVRLWFGARINDVNCGLRGFTREHYDRLDQRCTGMEFAVEMIIKSSLYKANIAEVPITLHPDGRRSHPPHLRTFRDGWRTLRFYLLYSPRWLFLYPGLALMAVSLLVAARLLIGPLLIGGITFDINTLVYAAFGIVAGTQSVSFAVFTKVFSISEGLLPEDARIDRFASLFKLEHGLILGALLVFLGIVGSIIALRIWEGRSFGDLDPARSLRLVVPAVTALTVGFQLILTSFLLSVLGLKRRRE